MVIEQCFVLDDQQFDGMSSFEVVVQPICQDQAKNLRGPTLQKHRSIIFNQVNRRSEMKALIGSVLALGVMGSAYAQVNCNTFLNNTINRAVNQDVLASGYTCTIARTGFVNGNVIQTGEGSLVIRGVVNGGVSESGNGNVDVNGGNVGGDISERDAGNLLVRNGGSFNGTLEEAGGGYVKVTVTGGGANKGDIFETGAGSVFVITDTGDYEGSVVEDGGGDVDITVGAGTAFKGNVEEKGLGGAFIEVDGLFEGNVSELTGGDVLTTGGGTFKGSSEHQLPGACSNTILDFQGAICNLL